MTTPEQVRDIMKGSLRISRIPKKDKLEFMNLANDNFCGDYGMTLKYLMDNLKIVSQINYLLYEINEIKKRLDAPKEENTVVKTFGNRKIEVKK